MKLFHEKNFVAIKVVQFRFYFCDRSFTLNFFIIMKIKILIDKIILNLSVFEKTIQINLTVIQ